MDSIAQAVAAIQELDGEFALPKHVKSKLSLTIEILNKDDEKSLKVSRALNVLEVIAQDSNVSPDTRTQLLTILTLLESA